jgi:predicted transcriptional regulator
MSHQIRLRIDEAKQRDAGRMKARINDEAMKTLQVKRGDILAIHGGRMTTAIAWPAFDEDQGHAIIRIDGLIRKNAEVLINEFAIVEKAEVNNATSMTLTPIGISLNVDQELRNWIKSRLQKFPMVTGDQIFVVMKGSAIPFRVKTTNPPGIVTMTSSTRLRVSRDPEPGPSRINLQMPLLLAICLDGPKTTLELLAHAKDAKINRIQWRLQHLVNAGFLMENDTTDENTYALTPKGTTFLRGFILNISNLSFSQHQRQTTKKATPQSFNKIVVHNKDGTTREVTRFDELVLVFTELETRKETIESYSDERLNQEIERITTHIQHRKAHHPENLRGWRGLARTLFLEKHRWLLMEEKERRTRREQTKT